MFGFECTARSLASLPLRPLLALAWLPIPLRQTFVSLRHLQSLEAGCW